MPCSTGHSLLLFTASLGLEQIQRIWQCFIYNYIVGGSSPQIAELPPVAELDLHEECGHGDMPKGEDVKHGNVTSKRQILIIVQIQTTTSIYLVFIQMRTRFHTEPRSLYRA